MVHVSVCTQVSQKHTDETVLQPLVACQPYKPSAIPNHEINNLLTSQ